MRPDPQLSVVPSKIGLVEDREVDPGRIELDRTFRELQLSAFLLALF